MAATLFLQKTMPQDENTAKIEIVLLVCYGEHVRNSRPFL